MTPAARRLNFAAAIRSFGRSPRQADVPASNASRGLVPSQGLARDRPPQLRRPLSECCCLLVDWRCRKRTAEAPIHDFVPTVAWSRP